ncbi:MAG TPA: histidine--tRNA ligase [Chloroflexi bacterium]|nr:histidine--tRNA ligase [Chloroflexota bacterium]
MKKVVQAIKGTRDFYPEEMAVRSWLYRTIRRVSELHGYQEYEAPILEKLELYAAKSGEELVKEQAFVFEDRGGDLIALRPELTPSLARMVAQRQKELTYPLRWWSFGPFWRYERPQKGRTREFFQWNIDLIGADSPESDAELISIAAAFFKAVGLDPDQVVILVNNRRLMEAELARLQIKPELKGDVFRLIDRRDKMTPDNWTAYARDMGLSEAQMEGLTLLLSDEEAWKRSEEMTRLFTALEQVGVKDYVQFDAGIIRGLEYYTGTVFEARDRQGEGRAILGGGHYDNLVADVGGDPLSGVGFAMGDVMIRVILEKYQCLPELNTQPAQVLVTVFDEDSLLDSLRLAAELRARGANTIVFTEPVRLQKQLKFADKAGVRFVVIVGPDERQAGQVTVKDLAAREQTSLSREQAAAFLSQKLAKAEAV